MKKTLYVLNIDNYCPEITEITYPLLRHWAAKMGAEFRVINNRQFPSHPVVYEKLQIHELGQDNDWNLYVDSDALVHPETPDLTEFLPPHTVFHHNLDMANVRFRYDEYFRRDGRNIGSCNWLAIAPRSCLDLWRPCDLLSWQMVANIFPTPAEEAAGIRANHLIDDYALSRNIARFGLKANHMGQVLERVGLTGSEFFFHKYLESPAQKLELIRETVKRWKLEGTVNAG